MYNIIEQFRAAMQDAGITPPDTIQADGKLHRFSTNGKYGDRAGWYVLHPDQIPAGAFGDWRTDTSETWRANTGRKLSQEEEARHRARVKTIIRHRDSEKERLRTLAREKALAIWQSAEPAPGDHPYLENKRVKAHGLRVRDETLVIPACDNDGLQTLQLIPVDGEKRFLPGGRVHGCYFLIGTPVDVLCIAEGFSTAASIHQSTGHAVVVAFNAGNLVPVAQAIRTKWPKLKLVICADDDICVPGNPGLTRAREAAMAVGGVLAVPDFGQIRPEEDTDFNDMYIRGRVDAIRACIDSAESVGDTTQPATAGEPKTKSGTEQASPSEAQELPDGARLLDEVHAFIKRFCVLQTEHDLAAVTLWACHAHMVGNFHSTPRLSVVSPEPESGKTRVLEILELLTPESLMSLSASPAAIFRTLEQTQITLLLDEVDTIWKSRGKDDNHEDLRALLNSGYRRGATIPRCVGPRHEVVNFPVFCAVALAGIGDMPDTIMSRSIIIRMRRRAGSEAVEPFRHRVHEEIGHTLRDQLAVWVGSVGAMAGAAWPELPEGIVDRKAECWEPLIAVADQAGGHWPKTARKACLALCRVSQDRKVSLGIRLLSDLRIIFGDADSLYTQTILERLCDGERFGLEADTPWEGLYGRGLGVRDLAGLLKKYDVTPVKVTINGKSLQGYRREHLWDAWQRYLSPLPGQPESPEFPESSTSEEAPPGAVKSPRIPAIPQVPDMQEATGTIGIAQTCRVDL